jgi:hypothetical protein
MTEYHPPEIILLIMFLITSFPFQSKDQAAGTNFGKQYRLGKEVRFS